MVVSAIGTDDHADYSYADAYTIGAPSILILRKNEFPQVCEIACFVPSSLTLPFSSPSLGTVSTNYLVNWYSFIFKKNSIHHPVANKVLYHLVNINAP